jgi:PAS domain-containing protein
LVRYFYDNPGARPAADERATVVEEAQRLLVTRLGCTSAEALGHLRRVADETEVAVAAVAATLLGEVGLDARTIMDRPPGNLLEPAHHRHRPGDPEATGKPAPWLDPVLDVIPTPAALLIPISTSDGRIVEFRIDRCNGEATDLMGRTPEQITGRRLHETFPGIMLTGIFEAYVEVMETGLPAHLGPLTYQEPINGVLYPALLSVRAQKMGDRLLVSWRFHDEEARLAARLDDVERMVRLGWAEWNLVTDEISWTRQIYELFGRAPADGPIALTHLVEHIRPEDLPVVTRAIRTLTERHDPATFEFRTGRRPGERVVSVAAEAILDGFGQLIALRAVMQDITVRRRIEEDLAASRLELERHRRHNAEELQRALLPEAHPDLPGLRVAVHYHPAEKSSQVGGDWYEATTLPDGRVLIVIGDASGHGLAAAHRMAQLRNAILGVAFTGADAAAILTCLNRLVFHTQDQTATATAVVAHYDPATSVLSWARAGHPPPILVRGRRARQLRNSAGALLGALRDPDYRLTTTRLEPGDLVVLYTDGLVERRGAQGPDRLATLLRTAGRCADSGPCAMVSAIDIGNPEDDTCVVAIQVRQDEDKDKDKD